MWITFGKLKSRENKNGAEQREITSKTHSTLFTRSWIFCRMWGMKTKQKKEESGREKRGRAEVAGHRQGNQMSSLFKIFS